jgi:hypothetical protein
MTHADVYKPTFRTVGGFVGRQGPG